jgi:selenocysteine-specific elongation factor
MFKDSPRTLVSGSRLHLYYGSAEVLCKVVLMGADRLESGQSGAAQLRLEEEAAVKKGDRFILRFYSPLESIGGGVILHPNPPKRRRFQDETLRALSALGAADPEEVLEQTLFEESGKMPDLAEIGRLAGLNGYDAACAMTSLEQKGKAMRLTGGIALHRKYWESAVENASSLLGNFHDESPFRPGMQKEEFRKRLGDKLFLNDNRLVDVLVGRMSEDKIISDNGNIIALPGFQVTYSPEILGIKEKIENEYKGKGVETPETEEFLRSYRENERATVTELLEALSREGRLIKLAYNCYIHADCYENAEKLLKKSICEKGSITLSEYRDMLGTSRKYAVRILEYTDQKKITRMEGEARTLI